MSVVDHTHESRDGHTRNRFAGTGLTDDALHGAARVGYVEDRGCVQLRRVPGPSGPLRKALLDCRVDRRGIKAGTGDDVEQTLSDTAAARLDLHQALFPNAAKFKLSGPVRCGGKEGFAHCQEAMLAGEPVRVVIGVLPSG